MLVIYTNRKGLTYTLYRGQTKTGKPRYYFGLAAETKSFREGIAPWQRTAG